MVSCFPQPPVLRALNDSASSTGRTTASESAKICSAAGRTLSLSPSGS